MHWWDYFQDFGETFAVIQTANSLSSKDRKVGHEGRDLDTVMTSLIVAIVVFGGRNDRSWAFQEVAMILEACMHISLVLESSLTYAR